MQGRRLWKGPLKKRDVISFWDLDGYFFSLAFVYILFQDIKQSVSSNSVTTTFNVKQLKKGTKMFLTCSQVCVQIWEK